MLLTQFKVYVSLLCIGAAACCTGRHMLFKLHADLWLYGGDVCEPYYGR